MNPLRPNDNGANLTLATVALSAFCLYAAARAMHSADGGHLSLDAVQQLVEAATGASVSWSPPFMSAALQWLGTGVGFDPAQAVERFLLVVVVLLWGGMLLAAAPTRAVRGLWVRTGLVGLIVIHPVLVAYAGIVWKDVLLGALVSAALGAALAALARDGFGERVILAAASMVLIGLLPQVRQHGMILAPALAVLPVLSVAWMPRAGLRLRFGLGVALVGVLLGTLLGVSAWSEARIREDDSSSTSVGFRSVFLFDLAGIEARVDAGPLRERGLTPADDARLVEVYTPDRIDTLPAAAGFDAMLAPMPLDALRALWWRAVAQHPGAYVRHRLAVFRRLLGVGEGGVCLPLHLGVGGNPDQIAALGLVPGSDARDFRVYSALKPLFSTPLFSQAWTLAALALVALRIVFLPRRSRVALAVPTLAALAMYASFVFVGIACDYRYLFTGLVMTLMLWAVVIIGWREAGDAASEKRP